MVASQLLPGFQSAKSQTTWLTAEPEGLIPDLDSTHLFETETAKHAAATFRSKFLVTSESCTEYKGTRIESR